MIDIFRISVTTYMDLTKNNIPSKLPLRLIGFSVNHAVGSRYNKSNTFDARLFRRGKRPELKPFYN